MSLSFDDSFYMTTRQSKPPKSIKSTQNNIKRGGISSWIPASKNKKLNKIKGVIDFFKENSATPKINKVVVQVEERQHLQAELFHILSTFNLEKLASEIEPGVISANGELKLQVTQSAVGAKLKQRLPSIANGLKSAGWPIKSLSIKVTPGLAINRRPQMPNLDNFSTKVMPDSGKRAWENLASSLPADSKLLDVVSNLLKKLPK